MGGVISRFRGEPSKKQELESIDKEIRNLEEYKVTTQAWEKRLVGYLIFYSIVFYVVAMLVLYFLFFPPTWKERAIYSIPLLAFPLLVWGVKCLTVWYYGQKILWKEDKLMELRRRKRKIIENVMETETFKVASEILEKHAPDQLRRLFGEDSSAKTNTPKTVHNSPSPSSHLFSLLPPLPQFFLGEKKVPERIQPVSLTPFPRPMPAKGMELRRRLPPPPPPPQQPSRIINTNQPSMQGSGMRPSQSPPSLSPPLQVQPQPRRLGVPPGPPIPRPVPPRERGLMDRVVEYLVGEGPNNRYALICKQCHSHNGMALEEEFEYIMNPARKQRPQAPRLNYPETASDQEDGASGDQARTEVEAKDTRESPTEKGEGEHERKISDTQKDEERIDTVQQEEEVEEQEHEEADDSKLLQFSYNSNEAMEIDNEDTGEMDEGAHAKSIEGGMKEENDDADQLPSFPTVSETENGEPRGVISDVVS
ncbi:unnamed protein product [Darwinula stevensoni]|uniref:Endoplasmic reticulum junction formation protein lunapark n=1 Tax=Darwinula stevensoni TaxID=69355 RepID=A0A7R8ZYW8_9CRUS|nr:unnamed protein product [Darwinula stevensoni]CAG0882341.1 unnamed protein product [Darwinula stevensoni]